MIVIPSSSIYVSSINRGCHYIDIRKYVPLNNNLDYLALTFIPPGLVAVSICIDCAVVLRFTGNQLIANKNLVEGHKLFNPAKSEYPIYLDFQYDMDYKFYDDTSVETRFTDKLVYSDNECEFYDQENSRVVKGRKIYRHKEPSSEMIFKAKVIIPSIKFEYSKIAQQTFNHVYE